MVHSFLRNQDGVLSLTGLCVAYQQNRLDLFLSPKQFTFLTIEYTITTMKISQCPLPPVWSEVVKEKLGGCYHIKV